jgi:GxxExxY protein
MSGDRVGNAATAISTETGIVIALQGQAPAAEVHPGPDLLRQDRKIIVELKAVSAILDEHRAQVHNYLKATGYKLGLLINFSSFPDLHYERIVR